LLISALPLDIHIDIDNWYISLCPRKRSKDRDKMKPPLVKKSHALCSYVL